VKWPHQSKPDLSHCEVLWHNIMQPVAIRLRFELYTSYKVSQKALVQNASAWPLMLHVSFCKVTAPIKTRCKKFWELLWQPSCRLFLVKLVGAYLRLVVSSWNRNFREMLCYKTMWHYPHDFLKNTAGSLYCKKRNFSCGWKNLKTVAAMLKMILYFRGFLRGKSIFPLLLMQRDCNNVSTCSFSKCAIRPPNAVKCQKFIWPERLRLGMSSAKSSIKLWNRFESMFGFLQCWTFACVCSIFRQEK